MANLAPGLILPLFAIDPPAHLAAAKVQTVLAGYAKGHSRKVGQMPSNRPATPPLPAVGENNPV